MDKGKSLFYKTLNKLLLKWECVEWNTWFSSLQILWLIVHWGVKKTKVFITRVDKVNWPPNSDVKADARMVHGQHAAGINYSG